MKLKVFHKGLILVAAPLALEILLIISLASLLLQSDSESLRELKYRKCAALGAKLISISNEAVIAMFGCYHANAQAFIQLYDADRKKIDEYSLELMETAKGNRLCEQAALQLVSSLKDLAPLLDQMTIPAREGKRIFEVSAVLKKLQKQFSAVRETNMQRMASVSRVQEKIAQDSARRYALLQRLQFQILLAGLLLNIIVGAGLLLFFRRSIFQRLNIVMKNTALLAEGAPLNKRLSGSDEIAQLDAAFHIMDSELKAATEREQSLFENANDVICVLNKELEFLRINPVCKKLWGYSPEELSGKSIESVLAAEESQKLRVLLNGEASKSELNDLDLVLSKSGGERLDTLWSTYLSENEGGRLYCVVHDLSEQKQVERSKQAFLSMLSSDLRAPLSKIADDLSQLLGPLKSDLSEKTAARLEAVRSNIARLLQLVNDLLSLAHSQSKNLESKQETVDVLELLKRSVQDLEGMAAKRKIEFEIDCQAESCYADPNKIMQVLVNLGSNAIKFSPQGSTVKIQAVEDGNFVLVSVIDRGRGVPETHLKSIFEKFQQVELADGKRKSGTGLGLPICKEIVEEGGGQIRVESRDGEGANFCFSLPANEDVFQARVQAQETEKKARYEAASLRLTADEPRLLPALPSAGSNLSLMKKGLLLIGVPILFELIFVGSISSLLLETEKSRNEELHERQVASQAYKLLDSYFNCSLMVVKLKSYENWLLFDQMAGEIIQAGKELKRLLKKDKQASAMFAPVEKVHDEMVAKILYGRKVIQEGFSKERAEQAVPDRFEIWARSAAISRRLSRLIDDSVRKEFVNPEKQMELRKQQGLILALGLASNILLSLFLARFFSADITSRLALQADNAARMSRGKALNPALGGVDEIAVLDLAFHRSAEKLAEARKRERAIFDNSKDLICVLDQDGHFLSSNPACEKMFLRRSDELRSLRFQELLAGAADKEVWQKLMAADLSTGSFSELSFKGEESPIHALVSVTRKESGANTYLIAHDISERKELEQMKQDFLSVVSHDLRSPLTSIAGTATFIEMGATGELGAKPKELVHDMVLQAEKLIDLINDLLDLEKIQAGKMELSFQMVSAGDLLEKFCAEAEARLKNKRIDILDESGDPLVTADPERLSQALSSIILYVAAKYPEGCCLRVKAKRTFEKEFLCWQIPDPELKASEGDSLFEKGTAGAASLALPLSKSIILAHGGKLELLASENGTGSVFQVLLPAQFESSKDAAEEDTLA